MMISDGATAVLTRFGQQLQTASHSQKGDILKQAIAELGWGKDKNLSQLKKARL